MPNILIVEDELIAAEYLKEILQQNGFNVLDIIDNGKEAKEKIPLLKPDIVLMDIMLKDNISGSEVALYLKQVMPDLAIIFLTAYADNEMVEYAIEANSYGYLMKPYNEKEIVNTLKVIMARIENSTALPNENPNEIQINKELLFNIKSRKLLQNSVEVKLGKNGVSLIEILCKNINATVSNEQISMHVWGEVKNDVTIRTQIHRMKEKIGESIIQNVNGVGYMIESKR
ncbi:MAG: response regulator [Campylobacterota bacterium]|nr:response regulator [Campylobacterota bacterium]